MTTTQSQTATWTHLRCGKCGSEFKVAVPPQLTYVVRELSVEDEEWGDGMGCPVCTYHRGGHYPLQRVRQEGEREALAEFAAAHVAWRAAEVSDVPPQPPADADEATLEAYAEADDAWYDRIVAAEKRREAALQRVKAMGYTDDELDEIEIAAEEESEKAAAKSTTTEAQS
jgi:hypothetical protein